MVDAGGEALDHNNAARVVANWKSGHARVLLQHVANSGGFKVLGKFRCARCSRTRSKGGCGRTYQS